LVGGYYKTQVSRGRVKKEYDICFISQTSKKQLYGNYNVDSFYGRYNSSFVDVQFMLFDYLQKYIRETDCRMVVCLRSDSKDEAKIYKDLISDKCTIIYNDRQNFSTYRAVEQSEMTISLFTTVLADVFSWGSKVLYANLLNNEWFETPEAGISYFSKNDYVEFRNKVDELLNMDIDDYRKVTQKNAKYICNYNPEKPAHEIIRSTILKEINCNKI